LGLAAQDTLLPRQLSSLLLVEVIIRI